MSNFLENILKKRGIVIEPFKTSEEQHSTTIDLKPKILLPSNTITITIPSNKNPD